ncbi:MAG: ankyrin repeat domain-containing protein [Synergistaceae bacterium]|nr:ankyrin repeat domain-containing protein [Synergistaceae bacterium]
MRRVFLCAVLVIVSVSSAFGDATEELLKIAKDENTTPRMIEYLIKLGADVNAKDKNSLTALMWAACRNSNPEVISVLLDARADVNAKDKDGWTALMRAAFDSSNLKVIDTLLNAGADIHVADNYGKTVLDYAATGEIKRYRLEKKLLSVVWKKMSCLWKC